MIARCNYYLIPEFLEFTKSRVHNLSSPVLEYQLPGLNAGDYWCLCALRWQEAHAAGFAPPIKSESTHARTLEFIELEILNKYFIP
jgi:uncharacterized protein